MLMEFRQRRNIKGNINHFKPTVITIQETKLRRLGIFKLPGYQVFEKVRSGFGGGLMTAVDENLSPVLISTGKKENSEILVVQVKAEKHDVRIINAYGPKKTVIINMKFMNFGRSWRKKLYLP